ncbi:MAG: glycosyltransferase family 2 protein [Acidobacteria bacterium]|nr:glycosyltransferase family 2 protein [Acidobacteriota bacterium]MCW5971479.1 glycosyltransferase family 2 protein [Blastocatellales bacterium]
MTQNAANRFDTDEVPELSIFLPVYDEADNLIPLHDRITEAMAALGRSYEVIYVDDGSSDAGLSILAGIAARDRRARVISFSRNYGQTAAMAAGIRAARGLVLIPMDADLQNDPRDIRRLLEKLDEGYDVVSGWRRKRSDGFLLRTLPSKLANLLVSRVGRVPLHDYGCTLKAYRSEILKNINLYGEMHRFIPIYAAALGARIAEIEVDHHPRTSGKSKYGLSRTVKVLFDLVTIRFLTCYSTKPMYAFGWAGLLAFSASALALVFALLMKYAEIPYGAGLSQTPLPVAAMIFFAFGVQCFLLGLVAEMVVRTYHESQDKPIYSIRRTINFSPAESAALGKKEEER